MSGTGLKAPVVLMVLIGCAARAEPPVTALNFSPDGSLVVVGSQRGLELRRWPDLDVRRRLDTQLVHVHDAAFSPDGRKLAAGGGTPAVEGTVEVYNVETGEVMARASPHDDLVYALAWSDDGEHLATAGGDRIVRWLESATLKTHRELVAHSGPVLALALLNGSDYVVSAGADHTLRVWRGSEDAAWRTLDNHTQAVLCLAARPRSEPEPIDSLPMVVSAGQDQTVRFWQPTIGRLVRFARLPSVPQAVCWTADGQLVAAICRDGTVPLIDPATAEIRSTWRGLEGVGYCIVPTPEGGLLVGGQHGQLARVQL